MKTVNTKISPFAIQINSGFCDIDVEDENKNSFKLLQDIDAIKKVDGIWKLNSIYRIGIINKDKNDNYYLEAQYKDHKNLSIDIANINDAKVGDSVLVKRIMARRGKASAKVVHIIKKSNLFTLAYISDTKSIIDIKTREVINPRMDSFDLTLLNRGTILKIDVDNIVIEILGNIDNPKIDEKISLILNNRFDEFDNNVLDDAKSIEKFVDIEDYPDRVDLRELDFCTIDPISAKDFDDAIYFDNDNYILYVAIADVSSYVEFWGNIDKEAKNRGFTTYFPHKSFPMLPRTLSENICSLKPCVDRLAFVCKITLDRDTLKPIKEEFIDGVIHSKYRFNYDDIDNILENGFDGDNKTIENILVWLLPLYKITQDLKHHRLKSGFDFKSQEGRIKIDKNHLLKSIEIEKSTSSHSLIEECMLLANMASAKMFEDDESIFRVHDAPKISKIETLLSQLSTIDIFVKEYKDSPDLIKSIQKEAQKLNLTQEVDSMIIKSLNKASYSPTNRGHFGLGFTHYSHFTSPIRRYSDLIVHHIIKAKLRDDKEELEYLHRNLEAISVRVSGLERDATKAEWDFRDRKFARWAKDNIGNIFNAKVIEIGDKPKAVLVDDMSGVVMDIEGDDIFLFCDIKIKIDSVDVINTSIKAIKI